MTFVRMRNDLQPLCPVHNSLMVPCQLWLKVDVDVFPKPCYACETLGCRYHYDIVQGYYTASEGEHIDRDMKYWLKCRHDGLPMHIAGFDPLRSKRTWKCGQLGCGGGHVTEGPVPSSAAASA